VFQTNFGMDDPVITSNKGKMVIWYL